jgi:hypothetical protein
MSFSEPHATTNKAAEEQSARNLDNEAENARVFEQGVAASLACRPEFPEFHAPVCESEYSDYRPEFPAHWCKSECSDYRPEFPAHEQKHEREQKHPGSSDLSDAEIAQIAKDTEQIRRYEANYASDMLSAFELNDAAASCKAAADRKAATDRKAAADRKAAEGDRNRAEACKVATARKAHAALMFAQDACKRAAAEAASCKAAAAREAYAARIGAEDDLNRDDAAGAADAIARVNAQCLAYYRAHRH